MWLFSVLLFQVTYDYFFQDIFFLAFTFSVILCLIIRKMFPGFSSFLFLYFSFIKVYDGVYIFLGLIHSLILSPGLLFSLLFITVVCYFCAIFQCMMIPVFIHYTFNVFELFSSFCQIKQCFCEYMCTGLQLYVFKRFVGLYILKMAFLCQSICDS